NFENMTSATEGLALRLDGVPQDKLVYLSALPALLTQVGVVRDGKAITFEQMSEMQRKEILALNSFFSTNFKTNRAELVVRGAGNDVAESQKALEWMKLVITSPDWRPENLPRIRDVVDQTLSNQRNSMQGAEENWVNDPADAYWRQDNPLLLTTSSFLTRAHNVHRLRWMLKDAGPDREAISGFMEQLAAASKVNREREHLKNLLMFMQKDELKDRYYNDLKQAFRELPPGAKALAIEAAKDLEQILSDIPDASLAMDWEYLARQIRHDLLVPPAQALANLNSVRQSLLQTGGARMFLIGSRSSQTALAPALNSLHAALTPAALKPVSYSK